MPLFSKINPFSEQYQKQLYNNQEFKRMIQRSSSSSHSSKTKFKIIFLGDQSTGKTSIIERFIHQKFSQRSNPTIGIDFLGKNIVHKGKHYRLQLWDTAGQQKFRSLIPSYLKDAICVVYVFDLSNPDSLINMDRWVQLFRQNKGVMTVSALCGNKLDLQSNFDRSLLQKFLQKNKMPFFQVSAKTGQKIENMFLSLTDLINEQIGRHRQANSQRQDETEADLPPLTKQPFVKLDPEGVPNREGNGCCSRQ